MSGPYRPGAASRAKILTCHPVLQRVVLAAFPYAPMDFTVVWGWRGKEDQDAAVASGASKTPWPTSKHNHEELGKPCSLAVDVAPWYALAPNIRWNRGAEFTHLCGFILGIGQPIAHAEGFRLRWGGDFNGDGDLTNDRFIDNDHIELVKLP